MAHYLDPTVELSLIQKRFPDINVSECGSLVSDFFCARKVGTRTFEGRLFLTENAVFFVSTYSDAHSIDLCLRLPNILLVTTFHKSILPSIEISLKEKDELFTNFYTLKTVVSSLSSLLPGKVIENKSAGTQRKLNRLLSVPARQRRTPTPPPDYHTVIKEEAPLVKVPECPFFSKCSFCPRIPLCKLQHGPQLKQDHGLHSNESSLISPSKRIHLLDKPDAVSKPSTSKKSGVGIEYYRSLSSPARVLTFSKDKSKESKNNSEPKRAVTDSLVTAEKDGETKQPTLSAFSTDGPVDNHSPSLVLPPSFEFATDGQIPKTEVKVQTPPTEVKGQQDDSVFVFTASNPSSPKVVGQRRRNAGVTFSLPRDGVRGVGAESVRGEAVKVDSDEHLAMLAQQLELGSDSDSLQGDLDLDHQRRLLASFGDGDSAGISLTSAPPIPNMYNPLEQGGTSGGSKEGDVKGGGPHKRRHCLHFLAGSCPRGADCPEYHGVAPDNYEDLETMIQEDEFSMIEIPSVLKVFPASALGRGDINSGDKIILSPHVLLACEQKELSYPVAFKLEHSTTGKSVHAGVLEFTSPEMDHGYLPQWMIDHLGVSEGESVDFKHVDLPKGQFVRLQPVSSAWLGIPYDKRMAMMEFQLRNFQTLTEGTKVTLTYELNRYTLKVLECKPAKGVSIVDADLTTDVVEPADFNRYHSIEEGQAVNTCLDEPTKCSEEDNSYRHFVLLSLPGKPLPPCLRVQVCSSRGDTDLFLSQSCTAPSQTRYTWCEQSVGDSVVILTAGSGDGEYDVNKSLYAGVVSLCEETEFTVTFHTAEEQTASNDATHSDQSKRCRNSCALKL